MKRTFPPSPTERTRRALLQAGGAACLSALLPQDAARGAPDPAEQPRAASWCEAPRFETALPLRAAPQPHGMVAFSRVKALEVVADVAPRAADPAVRMPRFALAYRVHTPEGVIVNPTLVADTGDEIDLVVRNTLRDAVSSVHWHGLVMDEANDGVFNLVEPGSERAVRFRVRNRAATYWYHPHPHGTTAGQTFSGMCGLLIVRDAHERALAAAHGLELGVNDLPLVVQDARYDRAGNPVYAPSTGERFEGTYGDCVTVNGVVTPVLTVPRGWLRLRVANAANARVLKLGLRHQGQWLAHRLIATDGGLLDRARPQTLVFVAPGQRVELLVDTGNLPAGVPIFVASDAFDPMQSGLAPHPAGGKPQGTEFTLARIDLTGPRGAPAAGLPDWTAPLPALPAPGRERDFTITTDGKSIWRLNGRTYKADQLPIQVTRGAREQWNYFNSQKGMPHPMHVHGFPMRVLARKDSPDFVARLAVDDQGRLTNDLGLVDTVLVWPGESVSTVLAFEHPFTGTQRYVVHCHNLEHEDIGLMLNFAVKEETT